MLENAEASNLLGLMIDDALGLSVDPSRSAPAWVGELEGTNQKNAVFLEQGQACEASGVVTRGRFVCCPNPHWARMEVEECKDQDSLPLDFSHSPKLHRT